MKEPIMNSLRGTDKGELRRLDAAIYSPWVVYTEVPMTPELDRSFAAARLFGNWLLGKLPAACGCPVRIYGSASRLRDDFTRILGYQMSPYALAVCTENNGILTEAKPHWVLHELIHSIINADYPECPDCPYLLSEGIPQHLEALHQREDGVWTVPWSEMLVKTLRTVQNALKDGLRLSHFLDMAIWKDVDWIHKSWTEPTAPGMAAHEEIVLFGLFAYAIRFMDESRILKPYYKAVKTTYYSFEEDPDWHTLDMMYPLLESVAKDRGMQDVEASFREWARRDWQLFETQELPKLIASQSIG